MRCSAERRADHTSRCCTIKKKSFELFNFICLSMVLRLNIFIQFLFCFFDTTYTIPSLKVSSRFVTYFLRSTTIQKLRLHILPILMDWKCFSFPGWYIRDLRVRVRLSNFKSATFPELSLRRLTQTAPQQTIVP